ncbi:MAG: hypothetical protein HZB41_13875 [Ignavibacteriae bacterium]|nr:hypothetical protein [Ignavibacteriota bacterium]
MKSILLSFVFIVIIVLSSCNEPTGDGDEEPGVYITVVDSITGKPMDSVLVRAYYNIHQVEMDSNYKCNNQPNPFNQQTEFRFDVYNQQNVMILLYQQEDSIIIDTLCNQEMKAGRYAIVFRIPDSLFDNNLSGFYTLKLQKGDSIYNYETLFLKFNYLSSNINNGESIRGYLTKIDGTVLIKKVDFPWIGRRFRKYLESGINLGDYIINDSIKIEISSKGYKTTEQIVELKAGKKYDITIKLVK